MSLTAKTEKQVLEMLFEKSVFNEVTACREWKGYVRQSGYGEVGVKFLSKWNHVRVHRLAWMLMRGDIPKGLQLRHLCHNKICINTEHLMPGTSQENIQDNVIAGRQAKGEKHGKTKYTEKEIKIIRKLRAIGTTQRKVANIFGTGKTTIANIEHRRVWRHVV